MKAAKINSKRVQTNTTVATPIGNHMNGLLVLLGTSVNRI